MVDQAEIHRKAMSGKIGERRDAVWQLRINFAILPDKEQAWKDLHRLTHDEDDFVRSGVADAFGTAFPHIPDKEQAWKDLHQLTQDEDRGVLEDAAVALVFAFPHVPDKEQAWEDLIRLIRDENIIAVVDAYDSTVLRYAFLDVPDKEQAWEDLIRLTHDENSTARQLAAYTLDIAFPHAPDKEQAWEDLHRLIHDEDGNVRQFAAYALDIAFLYAPDKEQAWKDLHRLTQDEDSNMRHSAAKALGPAFPHAPDKEQAWEDMYRLTQDRDIIVRLFANHSLGRASIFKATESKSEESFRDELEKALKFFESSVKETTIYNPSKFCLPFYKALYAITFEKHGAEVEVQKYFAEAKDAAEGSKSKEQLLEAIENLANALSEVQRVREANLDTIKRNLNAYRRYCDRAADLIGAAEEETPGAARILRRGLPIIDKRIKEIFREIQERAIAVCKLTQNTALEDLGAELNREGKNLLEIRDPIGLGKSVDTFQFILSEMCAKIPADKRGFAQETLEKAKNEPFVEDRVNLINIVLGSMHSSIGEIKTPIKIGKIEKSTGVQIGGKGNIQQIDVTSGAPSPEHDKHKFTLREIVYGAIIDIAIHALVIISIDHYLESSMDKIAPYLVVTFVMALAITIFALRKLQNAKSS